VVSLFFVSLWLTAVVASSPATPVTDPHSYARPAEARVTDVALDLRADFARKVFEGSATLTLQVAAGAREVVLDTRGLEIQSVADAKGATLAYSFGPDDRILGRALTIVLPTDRKTIVVGYRTSPDAEALVWLSPVQTAGGAHPYLFSQGQAILTRTWIPTQDSPAIRQTYRPASSCPPRCAL